MAGRGYGGGACSGSRVIVWRFSKSYSAMEGPLSTALSVRSQCERLGSRLHSSSEDNAAGQKSRFLTSFEMTTLEGDQCRRLSVVPEVKA